MTTNSSFNTFFKLIKVRDEHWSNFRYTLFNVLGLIRQHYKSGSVRQIGVRYGGLIDESYDLSSLFDDFDQM
uniref:Uncharacterized protein n=1 Tax=Streptococcus pyogenes TaxID=1314 RepID=A0A146BEW8_STRPY|nr:hypothetical protein [Streptococcus pyogenes]